MGCTPPISSRWSRGNSGASARRGTYVSGVVKRWPGLNWRVLSVTDAHLLHSLALACQAHDGGSPFATDPDYLAGRFLNGMATAALDGDRIVAAGAVRDIDDTGAPLTAITGLVDPAWRGQGIGGFVLDWALGNATGPPRVETEMLTPDEDAMLRGRGLRQTFGENVMRAELATPAAGTPLPGAVRLREWSTQLAGQFFTVYAAAFADRPGFPGWPRERWIEWISDDPDFTADWTLLADIEGNDVGFVAGSPDPHRRAGWIVQVGVVPEARHLGLGTALVAEVMRRMLAVGLSAVLLNVNINNPRASSVYKNLGFTTIGQRARYER
jgi:mycothiol synthase